MDDDGGEIREDQARMWLFLPSLQFHCVHTNIPIISNLIINSLFLNDHLSNIIHLNTALNSPFILPAVNRCQKCVEIKQLVKTPTPDGDRSLVLDNKLI